MVFQARKFDGENIFLAQKTNFPIRLPASVPCSCAFLSNCWWGGGFAKVNLQVQRIIVAGFLIFPISIKYVYTVRLINPKTYK